MYYFSRRHLISCDFYQVEIQTLYSIRLCNTVNMRSLLRRLPRRFQQQLYWLSAAVHLR